MTITLLNNPGGSAATLGGTTVNAAGGVATFTGLTLKQAAVGYTFQVTGGTLTPANTTTALTVTPGTASQVNVATDVPSTVSAGNPFSIVAAIEDAFGNVVTTAAAEVITLTPVNPAGVSGVTYGGSLTATTASGLATFSNLTVNKTGMGYSYLLSRTRHSQPRLDDPERLYDQLLQRHRWSGDESAAEHPQHAAARRQQVQRQRPGHRPVRQCQHRVQRHRDGGPGE